MARNTNRYPEEDGTTEKPGQDGEAANDRSVDSPIIEEPPVDVPDMTAGPAEGAPDDRVEALEAELAELKDRSLRALADAENTRRRAEREVADAKKYGASAIVKDLLNVSDNLRRALESISDDMAAKDEEVKNLVVGVEMVEKDLLGAFEKHGVRKIEPLGEKFDHDYHQAMYEVDDPDRPAGTVVELLQPGYVMHDRLLRPAMVAVSKGGPDGMPDDVDHVDTTA